jgi:hypothetical protein
LYSHPAKLDLTWFIIEHYTFIIQVVTFVSYVKCKVFILKIVLINKSSVGRAPNKNIAGVCPEAFGLTYKSRTKWKMLRGINSAIYGEVNSSVSVCVETKGDYIEK